MKILLKTACGCYKLAETGMEAFGRYHLVAIPMAPAPVSLAPSLTDAYFRSAYRQRKFEFTGQYHNHNGARVPEFQEVVE